MEFAASLIAVVGLADQVIRCCTRYLSAVRDCPSDIRVLLIETSTLRSVIGSLEVLCKPSPGSKSTPGLEQLLLGLGGNDGPIKGCWDCLAKIEKLLPKDRTQEEDDQGGVGGVRKKTRRALQPTVERLAWPLRETKAKKLVDELRRFRENISLALVVDLSQVSRHIDSKLQRISDQLDETRRGKILDWLVATDPSSYHNTTRALREQNTGRWLEKSVEYRKWKNEQGAFPLIWFYGIPGAGKTVLFSHVVEDIKAHCKVAEHGNDRPTICVYYYCYFGRNQDESLPLLRWIISQLARRLKYVPKELKDLFDSGHQPDLETVLKVIREISQRFQTIYILVDGLDESDKRANILRVIKALRDGFQNLKVFAMSREENDIKDAMGSLGAEMVSLSNPHVDEDIARYIGSELADNARLSIYPDWLKQEIERGLVEGARGMFRWASCQIDVLSRLHTISDIRKALGDLPQGLDETYERILLSIPEEHKHRAKRVLFLLASGELDDLKDVAEAIVVDIDNMSFTPSDRILMPKEFIAEMCTCLVRVDETKPQNPKLRFAHYTVKEYLYSDRIKHSLAVYFYSSDELAWYQTVMASLVYLLNISYEGVPSAEGFLSASPAKKQECITLVDASFPFLEAASSVWLGSSVSYIQDPNLRARVDSLLLKLFYPSPRHTKWIAWRSLTWDWIHPVWSAFSLSQADPHGVALTLACYFNMPSIVSMILAAKRQTATTSSSSTGTPLKLDESYAAYWTQIYHDEQGSRRKPQEYDVYLHPEDYLPSGTPLEIALRFDDTDCAHLLLLTCLQDISCHVITTPSGRRLSLLSVALKTRLHIWQDDFRLEHLGMLIELGASVNPSTTADTNMAVTETPLQSAAMLMNEEAVSTLLDAGADVNGVSVNCGCYESPDAVNGSEGDKGRLANGPAKKREVVNKRKGTCWGHKSPLRIVREIMTAEGIETSEVEDLLRLNGALDFDRRPT